MDSHKEIPNLEGYLFSDRNKNDELWSLRLETNENCNLLCRYCFASATTEKRHGPVEIGKIKRLVDQAGPLGLRSVIFIGPGEPLLYPGLFEVFEYFKPLKIIPVIITNGTLISEENARHLFDLNASILLKYDSMNPDTQDYLSGKEGTGNKIRRALSILKNTGYTNEKKLGLSFVTTKINISEVPDFWYFCRENNIFPNIEQVGEEGRAREQNDLLLENDDFMKLKRELSEIDKKFDYSWDPCMPLPGVGCNQFLYSCYVSGNKITPCAGVTWGIDYDDDTALSTAWYSKVFSKFRDMAQKEGCLVDGRYCWGCRGSAFNYWIKNGVPAEKAVAMQDPDCEHCDRKNEMRCEGK
uniref:Radical SAM superfamily enzyme, MoaA/NifB/PqqE/SkfB family n=1 Tax=Candidatus Kentrum sp. DK TaxID=2126562 RepID=A0A450S272_9GAMM|nr:MAG: Radical SAM superfamily enzyme, MoaA/NifB/PqqE/SkfB family [Candidatus Kentron sp. DK]